MSPRRQPPVHWRQPILGEDGRVMHVSDQAISVVQDRMDEQWYRMRRLAAASACASGLFVISLSLRRIRRR